MDSDLRTDVLGLIDQMRAASISHRVQMLSDQMEVLVRSGLEPSPAELVPGVHFTKMEGRIFARLKRSAGQLVTKDQILDAMYFDTTAEPHTKVVDVLIHRLRKKLENTPYRIDCLWAQGFKLRTNA